MELAKMPITITLSGSRIWKANIPQSQVALMSEWLEENNHRKVYSDREIASEIEKHYPGGLRSWGQHTGYKVEFK
ncbi:hypothetical protein [Amycolatopsis pigmentata]|uniref:Uncharacterized protein n=1 Tax=Amycolatopsis pigmentata TaxID=450801 RepID=A0ABW5G3M4_9PSEU